LRRVAPVDHFMIVLKEGDEAVFVTVEARPGVVSAIPPDARLPFQGSFLDRLKKLGRPYLIPDLIKAGGFPEDALILKDGLRSCARLPLYSAGAFLGMLALASRRPRAFNRAHLSYLEPFAQQVAHAVANIERYRQAKSEAARLAVIVREVHHRIKNNLQGVIGLLSRYRDEQPALAPVLHHAIGQLHAVAEVHNLLSRHTRETVRLPELVGGVCQALAEFCPHRLELTPSAPAARLTVLASEAVPAALVVNELIQNAIDHGYPDGRRGTIRVDLDERADAVALRIADDGVPPAQDINSENDVGYGIGLNLVRTLLPARDASFRLYREGDWTVAEVVYAKNSALFVRESRT
jgi:two-component sensor histidine kinase